MTKSKSLVAKELAKMRVSERMRKFQARKEIAALTGVDKLNYDIGELQRWISSTKYDISNGIKCESKLKQLQETLNNKKHELELLLVKQTKQENLS